MSNTFTPGLITVPAGTSTDYHMPHASYGALIQALPGAGGTANVQYSASPIDAKDADSLQDWVSRDNTNTEVVGTTSALSSGALAAGVQWLRLTATTADAKFYISLIR